MRDVGTLLEALPYIREFHGKTVVIKYGGAAMEDPALREEFARDVVLLKYVGLNPIVVHGGGPEITRYMEKLGLEVQFHEGLRVSAGDTVEIAKMVLVGKLNSEIVQRLNRAGQAAVGLAGEDGTLFEVSPAPNSEQVGFVGSIDRVDFTVIGPAVNLVSRIEAVAKALDQPIVVSDDFARAYGGPLQPLGRHELRGLATPHDLFAPAASAAPP